MVEFHIDTTHFGKLKGESIATNKTESQIDIHDLTDCDFCKDRNCKDCEGGKNKPQTKREGER